MTRFAVQTDTVNQSSTSAAYAEGRVDDEKMNTSNQQPKTQILFCSGVIWIHGEAMGSLYSLSLYQHNQRMFQGHMMQPYT